MIVLCIFCIPMFSFPPAAVPAGLAGNRSLTLSCRSTASKSAGLCHINSLLFNNSSVLLCILGRASLLCQMTSRRKRESKKKKAACASCLSLLWSSFLFCHPRAAALSDCTSSAILPLPPHAQLE